MGNLNIGGSAISIKDAIRTVENNIVQFQQKKDAARGYASATIVKFYDDKIATQEATLSWLNKALQLR